MIDTTILVDGAGVTVGEVRCHGRLPAWSAEEPVYTLALILLRRGSFERRVNGRGHEADPITGYLQRPGSVQRIAHHTTGDLSTVIAPDPWMLGDLNERVGRLDAFRISPIAELQHVMFLARVRAGAEPFELSERALVLAGSVMSGAIDDSPRRRPTYRSRRDRVVVDDVRSAISGDVRVRLDQVAAALGIPAYELSRTFHRRTGETVNRYRLRLRLHRALRRMAEGDRDLAGVAVASGFADQAHFTRALREETGWTPGAFRSELAMQPSA